MLAWTMATELHKVPLADGFELLLLARDLSRRGSIGVCLTGTRGFTASGDCPAVRRN